MGNFRLFQQARCEVITKYTNCNLLEHELIRTGKRTLEAQIEEKNIEAWQNVNGSYEKKSVRDYSSLSNPNGFQYIPCWQRLHRHQQQKARLQL